MMFPIYDDCIAPTWPTPYINAYDTGLYVEVELYAPWIELYYPKLEPITSPAGKCGEVVYNWVNPTVIVSQDTQPDQVEGVTGITMQLGASNIDQLGFHAIEVRYGLSAILDN